MNVEFKTFNKLPEEAKNIRTIVFSEEQGFREEFNSDDNNAIHILMFLDQKAIATARVIYSKEHNSYIIGRFAVLKEYRNHHYGKELLRYSESVIITKFGHIQIGVSAQERAIKFYEKCGYIKTNISYLDENYPHTWMIKQL